MGAAVNLSHIFSAASSSSEGGLLTLLTCSNVGFFPLEIDLHNFSNVNLSQGLQFFTNCSSLGPFHMLQSTGTGCPNAPPHSKGPQEACYMWASKRVTASFMHPPVPEWGPPRPSPFRGAAASAWSSPQVAENFCSSTWRTSCPSLFVCRDVFFNYSHFCLWLYWCFPATISPFLNLLS